MYVVKKSLEYLFDFPETLNLPFLTFNKMVDFTTKKIYKDIFLICFSLLILSSCSKDSPEFYFKNGNAKYQLKDYAGAIKDFDKAVELDPKFMQAYHTRAICFGELKKYDKALADFDKAIELDPDFKNAYLNRAYYVKINSEDFEGAIQDYNKFIELNKKGDNEFALNNRGFAKLKLNDLQGARDDIMKSFSMDSTNSYVYKNRALYFIAIDSINLACKDLNKAIDLGFSKNYGSEAADLLKQFCQ
jgi:tetratricopeptide (TPR) repeat protein